MNRAGKESLLHEISNVLSIELSINPFYCVCMISILNVMRIWILNNNMYQYCLAVGAMYTVRIMLIRQNIRQAIKTLLYQVIIGLKYGNTKGAHMFNCICFFLLFLFKQSCYIVSFVCWEWTLQCDEKLEN